jgi:uncharacterized protein
LAVFAIGDPHLSKADPKPMDIFGQRWAGHPALMFERWRAIVGDGDTVLIPGDISWAIDLAGAVPDLEEIDALPGRKVLIQGNHDYWWHSLKKLRSLPLRTIHFMQNDWVRIEESDRFVCGTRGWLTPGDRTWAENPEHNARIYAREVGRLRLSLESARKAGARRLIVMLHYPPVADDHRPTAFTDLLEAFGGVEQVVYGHLHGPGAHQRALQGERAGILYRLVACDALDFTPLRIL